MDKEQIINLILEKKLFIDNRGNMYGQKYNNFLSHNSGLWQHPDEFSDLLLFLQDKKIKTFLNIGTFNGYTFNFISDFLNKFNSVECTTIDPINHNPIIDERFTYLSTVSDEFLNQKYDLVFIDGLHTYNGVKNDYINVGQYAKYCVFHDINDMFVKTHPDNNGGVPLFWHELKEQTNKIKIEFDSPEKTVKIMGIGVLY